MNRNQTMRTYEELITIKDFFDRYRYLKIGGSIGETTFGAERYLNQKFYKSQEWRSFRREIIVRDFGCDLGVSDRHIGGLIIIHHINPITIDDIIQRNPIVLDPNNAICCSSITHKAIHYGDESLLIEDYVDRRPNDTIPWR